MSKADVLTRLKPKLKTASIEDIYVFTVEDWKNRSTNILQSLRKRFLPKHVVVRSSSCYEDMEKDSMAGCFYTELNVNSKNPQSLSKAVENVINSYKDRGGSKNQIVVQTQTK